MLLVLSLLALASCLFRLPALLNAAAVDSDAAIVGLQAMHILHGEWSPFLFGSGYQTSVDSFVAAGFFAVFGPTPLALMLSTFVGHLALTGLAFATLRRHMRPWLACILVLPLVFTPSALHTYILGPPRQAALTLVFLSLWLLDGASRARRPWGYALGSAVAGLAAFADPYALLFAPALGIFALLAARDGTTGPAARAIVLQRAAACLVGAVFGLVPLLWLWSHPGAWRGELGMAKWAFDRNWHIFTGEALPWILSTTAFRSRGTGLSYGPWAAPLPVRCLQMLGGAVFAVGALSGAILAFARRIPWEIRRLGVFGALLVPFTIAGFLSSVMVMDLFSTRYLAAIILASPFAMAPLAVVLRERAAVAGIAPYVLSAALAGWLGFGAFVDGPVPVRTKQGKAEDERALEQVLVQRGVTSALADYWVSYRLTFLYQERVAVVPIHAREDRYPPYRVAFDRAPTVAYVFDPRLSREDIDKETAELLSAREFSTHERIVVGSLTALILHRDDAVPAVSHLM